MQLIKYPRTRHIEGSRSQPGDEDLDAVPFSALERQFVVVEEKLDGANSALSFDEDGHLLLQSRGHYLTGGPRERHFDMFKAWAAAHSEAIGSAIGQRYIVYGEWLFAKHTIFYDMLTHYWFEYDVFDRNTNVYLSTERRRALLAGLPILPAPVLFAGHLHSLNQLACLATKSMFISDEQRNTEIGNDMEGLYIKVEEDDVVLERYKFVRASFLAAVDNSGSHWLDRPIVANKLIEGIDMFDAEVHSYV